jgi:hypothetical protein
MAYLPPDAIVGNAQYGGQFTGRIQGATSSVGSTPPTNPSAPAGSITVGGFAPDYAKLLTADPAYLAWQASSGQNVGNAAAARAAALKQLAIRWYECSSRRRESNG